MMGRSNVETEIVTGQMRKSKGNPLDADIAKLALEIAASRNRIFAAAKKSSRIVSAIKTEQG